MKLGQIVDFFWANIGGLLMRERLVKMIFFYKSYQKIGLTPVGGDAIATA